MKLNLKKTFTINSFKKKISASILTCTFLSLTAYGANTSEINDDIFFDFSHMNINANGLYDPKKDGNMGGLKAEATAKQDGIDTLSSYFKSSCDGGDKRFLNLKNNWESYFRSQGSEIYANGFLKIALQADIKQVFKSNNTHRKNIKSLQGNKIYFQLPPHVPASAVHCGAISLSINNTLTFQVVPFDTFSALENMTIVKLSYNAQKESLQPATPTDEDVLLKSSLVTEKSTATDTFAMAVVVSES